MPAVLLTTPPPDYRCSRRSHLYKSYPAAYALPLVGVFAFADSFLTSKGGLCSILVVGVDSDIVRLWLCPSVFCRFGSGEMGIWEGVL